MKKQLILLVVFGVCLVGCGETTETSEINITRSTRISVETLEWKGVRGAKQLVSRHYRVFTTTSGTLLKTLPGFLEAA